MTEKSHGGPRLKTGPDDARGAPKGEWSQPAFVPTDAQRAEVLNYAKLFPVAGERHIAVVMGISRDTLRKYFNHELELGRAQMLIAVASQVVNAALDHESTASRGDRDLQKFVLARLGGWSAKTELTGKDGGPLEVAPGALGNLSDEELEMYGRLSAKAEGIDADAVVSARP